MMAIIHIFARYQTRNAVIRIVIFIFSIFIVAGCSRIQTRTVSTHIKETMDTVREQIFENRSAQPLGFTGGQIEETEISFSDAQNEVRSTSSHEFIIKDDKDSTKTEPVLEPMVVAGTVVAVGGTALMVMGALAASSLLWIGAGLLVISAILTMIGWKRIKNDPKKFKGEKFAVASFIIIGLIGVASSFYLLYLLFAL